MIPKTDVDEQIHLVLTLGDMLGQDEQAKIDKFIETMPTMIQTHLIIEPTWAKVTKKAKEVEHIIHKWEAPVTASTSMQATAAVPGLNSHPDDDHSINPRSRLYIFGSQCRRGQRKLNR